MLHQKIPLPIVLGKMLAQWAAATPKVAEELGFVF
jgi:hypothetical protein